MVVGWTTAFRGMEGAPAGEFLAMRMDSVTLERHLRGNNGIRENDGIGGDDIAGLVLGLEVLSFL